MRLAISSQHSNCCRGAAGGERQGSATGGAPSGRRILHVEEQRRCAAPRRQLALALLGVLARFLAVLAADRERQRAQALLGDFLAALEAVAVVALLEPRRARR